LLVVWVVGLVGCIIFLEISSIFRQIGISATKFNKVSQVKFKKLKKTKKIKK